jgi:hypothetical protein
MAKIIQSDNAVVDYTTIQSLIDTVNNLSDVVDKLNISSKTVDATGKVVTQIVDSGFQVLNVNSSNVTIKFKKTFTAKPVVTATLMGGPKAMSVHIQSFADLTSSSVTFSFSEPAPGETGGSAYIHWIAVGQGSL